MKVVKAIKNNFVMQMLFKLVGNRPGLLKTLKVSSAVTFIGLLGIWQWYSNLNVIGADMKSNSRGRITRTPARPPVLPAPITDLQDQDTRMQPPKQQKVAASKRNEEEEGRGCDEDGDSGLGSSSQDAQPHSPTTVFDNLDQSQQQDSEQECQLKVNTPAI